MQGRREQSQVQCKPLCLPFSIDDAELDKLDAMSPIILPGFIGVRVSELIHLFVLKGNRRAWVFQFQNTLYHKVPGFLTIVFIFS